MAVLVLNLPFNIQIYLGKKIRVILLREIFTDDYQLLTIFGCFRILI